MAETSLVLELQCMARTGGSSITDLLHCALVVSIKLKIDDFRRWIEAELNGYSGIDVPEYRHVTAQIGAYDNFLRRNVPLLVENANVAKALERVRLQNSLPEIEQLSASEGSCVVPFPPELMSVIMPWLNDPTLLPMRFVNQSELHRIMSTVRTTVLRWSLKLEEEGILGEGMTFSNEEKQRAAQSQAVHVYGNNYGPIGHGSGHAVQIGDFGAIYQQLKDAGVSQADRNELENILDKLKNAKPEEKKSWAQKGMDWLGKNAGNLGSIAGALRSFFSSQLPPS